MSAGYRDGQEKSWGTLVSSDDGRTWTQRTVESGLTRSEWPTEPTVLFRGREIRAYDAGNANAVACGSRQFVATYTGSPTNTEIVVVSVPE